MKFTTLKFLESEMGVKNVWIKFEAWTLSVVEQGKGREWTIYMVNPVYPSLRISV